MAAIPYMPLYVADYLSDAAHLSTVEHGAYLLLIMTYWQRGEKLPDDDKKLARICRMGPREWARVKPSISEFFEVDRGGWFHSRIERELANVRAKSLNKRKGGLARAEQMHSSRSARAQQSDTDTDTEVPFSNENGEADKQFWDGAKAYLGKSKGSLIGKLAGEYGREAVAQAVTVAMLCRPQPPDRVSYVVGVLKRRSEVESRPLVPL